MGKKKKKKEKVGGVAITLELLAMIPYMDFLVVGQWHIFSFHRIKVTFYLVKEGISPLSGCFFRGGTMAYFHSDIFTCAVDWVWFSLSLLSDGFL